MSNTVETGQITDAKTRYSAGVLKYMQMGYWVPDYVPSATDPKSGSYPFAIAR